MPAEMTRPIPIQAANDGATQETAESYGGILGIPTSFVLDRDGKIVKRFVGRASAESFEEALRPLLTQTTS